MTLEDRITARFHKALTTYNLIEDGDHLLIGLSGGKDSLCLFELLARRQHIFKPKFTLDAIHVRMSNIDYETDTGYLENFARQWGVKLHVRTTSFDASTDKRKSPCFLCSWNRRKQMFELAQQLGCNKIALGHHMDDIIHTTLMNEIFQGRFATMPVSLRLAKMPLTIIRPLCLEHEADIQAYADLRHYKKQMRLCPYDNATQRDTIKNLYQEIERINPEARYAIWNALERDHKLIETEKI
jgi:tRNA 2-thiocytidine biosynthesis protein TtcA